MKEQGFSVAAIARKLEVSRNTVYKFLDMSLEEASDWVASLKSRKKKLDPYRNKILSWLKENPDLSSAQVEDWLKEHYPNLKIGGSTVRNYVTEIRDIYQTYTYDSMGNELTETGPMNHTTTYTYDANNNMLTKKDALGTVTNYTYDANGNQLSDGTNGYTYNADGTVETETDANGNTTKFSYDANGNVISQT